jgi:uncharacterized RDD family membrane protein YckC
MTSVPAPHWRVWLSQLIDAALTVALISYAARFLPTGPPPVDAMSFYSQQQFNNYFTMVAWAVLAVAVCAAMTYAPWRGTPGDLVARIRLASRDGTPLRPRQIIRRFVCNAVAVLLICLPGPLLALTVLLISGLVLYAPVTTADAALIAAGAPNWLRLSIHGLSFAALGLALWHYVFKEFTLRRLRSVEPTLRDVTSNSIYVLR